MLHARLVLQGMGPAFEIEVSQKVEDHLRIESVDPPLLSQGLTTRLSQVTLLHSWAWARAGTLPQTPAAPEEPANISEKLTASRGTTLRDAFGRKGKELVF